MTEVLDTSIFVLDTFEPEVDSRDWKAEAIFSTTKLPSKLDYRSELQPIRNQKSQGSCVAFAVCVMKEWQERQELGYMNYFSPQWIYNKRRNESSGMNIRDALNIVMNDGVVPERDFRYGSNINRGEWPVELEKKAKNYKLKSYARVSTIKTLKQALNTNGPCIITFAVYNRGMKMWVPSDAKQKPEGYHCMAVVGYNKEGFIIRNSWGYLWGKFGYTTFPYSEWGMHVSCFTSIDDKSTKQPEDIKPFYWLCWR